MKKEDKPESHTEETIEYKWMLKKLRGLDLKTKKEILESKENNDGDSDALALDRQKELLGISEESNTDKKPEEKKEDPSASDQKTKDSNSNTKCNKKHISEPHSKNKIEGKQKKKPSPSFLKKLFLSILILLLLGILAVVTYETYLESTNKSNEVNTSQDKNDYAILIDQWNEAAIKSDLSQMYLLPRDNLEELPKKLNILLSVYSGKKKRSMCQKKNTNAKISIPLRDYCRFVSMKTTGKQANFNLKMDEEAMISNIKTIANYPYVDKKLLSDIAYLNSFEIYFTINLQKFYKKGFSRNIKNYDQYQEVINNKH